MELAKVKVCENRLTVEKLRINVAGTIGATVAFEYDDLWNSMDSKTLVWRAGTVTKDDITVSGIVPAEVMERPGHELFVGVYGTKGNTATPTLWADLGYIYDGADPSGDETTAPSLPVWAQLENRVSDLEGEGLSSAVADYLEKNPVEAGATTEEAAQIKQNAENIKKLSDDKLDASKLPEAVNDALAKAKASGEFDGPAGPQGEPGPQGPQGTPGGDYVLTSADKTEIAELAAEMVEVPSGGGGSSKTPYYKVASMTTAEEVTKVEIPLSAEAIKKLNAAETWILEIKLDVSGSTNTDDTMGKLTADMFTTWNTNTFFRDIDNAVPTTKIAYAGKISITAIYRKGLNGGASSALIHKFNSNYGTPSAVTTIYGTGNNLTTEKLRVFGSINLPVGTKISLYAIGEVEVVDV